MKLRIIKEKTIEIINSINLSQTNKFNNRNNSNNNSYALDLFSKHRPIDGESLQMKNRQLKTEINKIKKILTNINTKNSKKDEEISKQESLLDQLLNINKQAYENTLSSLQNNSSQNIYDNNLICKINKQYLELKMKLKILLLRLLNKLSSQNEEIESTKSENEILKKTEKVII